ADGNKVEIIRRDGTMRGPGIGGVSVAGDNGGTLFIATSEGLYASAGGAPPVKTSSLSYARCAVRHGTKLYACSWNYPPDSAAVARSDDDGKSFTKVFQYADTIGLTQACGPTTPVAKICPAIWLMYAPNLGIMLGGNLDAGGSGDGGGGGKGCACGLGVRSGP